MISTPERGTKNSQMAPRQSVTVKKRGQKKLRKLLDDFDVKLLDTLIRIPLSFTLYFIEQISNEIIIVISRPNLSRFFYTLLFLNSKFKITTIPQIAL